MIRFCINWRRAAYEENTGARGLVNAVESAMLPFEKKLPSTGLRQFPATSEIVDDPEGYLQELLANPGSEDQVKTFERIAEENQASVMDYLELNRDNWSEKYRFTLTPSRMKSIAGILCQAYDRYRNGHQKD